jgi:hyperosmotically inducible protein
MKSIVLKALGAAAIAACLSGGVYAQTSAPAAAPMAAPAASEAPAAAKSDAKAAAKAARKANRKLGYAVRKAIAKGNGLDVSGLTVRTRGGVVTLSGTMPDTSQIDKAVATAKTVQGVTSVINKLTIKNSPA